MSSDTPSTIECPVGGQAHRVQRVSSMAVEAGSPLAMPRPPSRWLTALALALVAPGVALAILFSHTDGAVNRIVGTGVAVLLTCGVPWWVFAQRRYQMALFRWKELWYCQDCDGVFLPGSGGMTACQSPADAPRGGRLNRKGREERKGNGEE